MKKLLLLLCVLLFGCSAATISPNCPGILTAAPGQTLTCNATLAGGSLPAAFEFSITTSIPTTPIVPVIAGTALAATKQLSNNGTTVGYGMNQNTITDGVLVTYPVTIPPTATAGPFNINLANLSLVDPTGTSIPVIPGATAVINVVVPPTPVSITTSSPLPGATVGVNYSAIFTATGGVGPYVWSTVGATCPPGMTLSGAVFGGIPTAAVPSCSFTIQVKDSVGTTATKLVSIIVSGPILSLCDLNKNGTVAGDVGDVTTAVNNYQASPQISIFPPSLPTLNQVQLIINAEVGQACLTTPPAPPVTGNTPFVTSGVTGLTARNNISGFVGMRFNVVGPSALTVTALGRMAIAGNSGTHIVKIVVAAPGTDLPGGSVPVSMTGSIAGQFQYANLAAPVTLQAGTAYYVMSQEVNGGDQWYDAGPITTTAVAQVTNAIVGTTFPTNANTAAGPVNFQYQ